MKEKRRGISKIFTIHKKTRVKLVQIVSIHHIAKEDVNAFFSRQWGSPEMVISSGVYDCRHLDGFVALNNNEIIGLITFTLREQVCEIISLDSLIEGRGIGSALVLAVETVAKENHSKVVKVVTTNDNLLALKFYQKRGYCFVELYPNAVAKARKIKPTIPLIGNDGIPIRDELILQRIFRR